MPSIPDGCFTRRDFLKLSSATLLGLLWGEFFPSLARAASTQGRVLATSLVVRDTPAFQGKKLRSVKRDALLDLAEELWGGVEGDYNRLWYRLDGEDAYVYSGWVQPVQSLANPADVQVPESGALAELSVPFADSVLGLNVSLSPGSRLYYASTHWVESVVTDQRDGRPWLRAFDAATDSHYYLRPEWVHLYTADELAPLHPGVPAEEKHLEIHLSQQLLLAYEGDTLVYAARVATGRRGFESPLGLFHTFHKRPTYHMFGGADEFSIFDLPGVPWDSYITTSGVAIHGTYWHNDFGTPHSHGCINMAPADARWIFRWTSPTVPPGERLVLQEGIGTSVRIVQA